MQEFDQSEEMELGGSVGGIILNLGSSAIQLACVNSPVFGVENNIGKLVLWRMSVTPQS